MNAQLKASRPQGVKVLKEMGPPLNTLAPHHGFSLRFSRLESALAIAQRRLLRAAFKYVPEGQNASVGNDYGFEVGSTILQKSFVAATHL